MRKKDDNSENDEEIRQKKAKKKKKKIDQKINEKIDQKIDEKIDEKSQNSKKTRLRLTMIGWLIFSIFFFTFRANCDRFAEHRCLSLAAHPQRHRTDV